MTRKRFKDESARTMRIDLAPAREPEPSPVATWRLQAASDSTTYTINRQRREERSPDYDKLLQSVYDAVVITNDAGRIVDFNMRALDFFGCDADRMGRASVLDLISGAGEPLLEAVRENLREHRFTLIEARCVRADESTFPAEIAVNRIDLDFDEELCFFIRDVTVRKEAQEALEDAVTRLKAHDEARSHFISNVSHELRTPLTSMMYAVANMLRGVVGPISEQARTYLEMLQGDCLRLLTTVNDILDLRKLEAGTLELKRVKAPVVPLIRRAVESLALQARQKSVALTTEYAGGPWFVHGDAQKLERVLLNVVGNAIKFTPEGGGVQVVADAPPNDAGEVRIRVTDTGVGIPADAISKVTLRYFTVGQQPSGSGLGLAISKEIIALHRGELEIESPAPGQSGGTQVTVLLPRVQAPLVLVVDDDEAVCNVLQRQVADQGYRVKGALDGQEALRIIQDEQPDYLVLDVALPGLDGIELILRMQGEERLKRVPAVVVTGVPLSEARQQILKTLGVRLLPKPWDEEQLRLSLENYALGAHPSGEGAGVS